MTDVDPNTFTGPNQGHSDGYIAHTTISQETMDADMNNIKADLDKFLVEMQNIYSKLDTIDINAADDQTATEIVSLINASSEIIDYQNLDDVVIDTVQLGNSIETHRTTTDNAAMHPETSIQATGLTYSNTPSSMTTSCQNLLDEIKNLRFQISRLNGKSNWTDAPDINLSNLAAHRGSFHFGHTTWADGLSNEEIGRIQLQTGEKLVVERIEFQQKGGGTALNATLDVYDGTVLSSQTLGGVNKTTSESGTGNLILIRVSNSTGAEIDASISVHYRIEGV